MEITPVQPKETTVQVLKAELCNIEAVSLECRDTLLRITDALAHQVGGVIVVVMDGDAKHLEFSSLDGGRLCEAFRRFGARANSEGFWVLLEAFCSHTASDRWESPLLRDVACRLGLTDFVGVPELEKLLWQPKDGAIVLSAKSTVLAAAAQLRHQGQCQIQHADGTSAGTRHRAAVGTAERLGLRGVPGVVFVRSDAGGVHVILPRGADSSCLRALYLPRPDRI